MNRLLDLLCSQFWVLDEAVLRQLGEIVVRHVRGERLSLAERDAAIAAARGEAAKPARATYEVRDGVALIPVQGVIQRYAGLVGDISQPRGASVEAIRRDLDAALADPEVRALLLLTDSPGGSADGIAELADAIFEARRVKPVEAYADGMMASGAYWLGAQTQRITASRGARVGSIGVYSVLTDSHVAAEKDGYRVQVVRAGEFKGAGVPGTPVTDAAVTDAQRLVNDVYGLFVDAVARGRNRPAAEVLPLADGRVHVGAKARDLGLADEIGTLDAVVARLSHAADVRLAANASAVALPELAAAAPDPVRLEEDRPMDKPKDAPAPAIATIAELKAAFPDEAAFVLACAEKGRTLLEAQADFAGVLKARLDDARKPGNAPLAMAGPAGAGGTARDEFAAAVAVQLAAGLTRDRAVARVVAENPGLHRRVVEEANPGRDVSRVS